VQLYASALEAIVLAAPYQWFNFYDYWPEGGDKAG
jgi:predicted LPLAT superfamily acyltransferase